MWFEIEPDSSLIAGLYKKFKEIQLVNKVTGRSENAETDEGNNEKVHGKGGLARSLGTRTFGFA